MVYLILQKKTGTGAPGFNISSPTYVDSTSSFGMEGHDVRFNDDGTKIYIVNISNNNLVEKTLSTPWEVSTSGANTDDYSFGTSIENYPFTMFFKDDGTQLLMTGSWQSTLNRYSMSPAWDISSLSLIQSGYDLDTIGAGDVNSLWVSPDATKIFATQMDRTVRELTLSNVWNSVASVSQTYNYDISGQTVSNDRIGLAFNNDGTKMFTSSNNNGIVYQHNLSTGWDLSTASYSGTSFDIGHYGCYGIVFGNNGTKLYITNTVYVDQYDL